MPAFFLSAPGIVAAAGVLLLVLHRIRSARRGRAAAARDDAPSRLAPAVISLVVVATTLYVVIARPEATGDHKWAYAVIGTIAGYWLRGRT